MPSRLDAEAAHTAAETLPRAIEVNAIDDCTVDGSVHRNSTPRYRSGVTSGASRGRNTQPISGNSTKVLVNTTRCSRQCVTPASTACRDSLAPCRKNSSMIAPSVSQPNAVAHAPRQGSTLDSSTVSSSAQVKRSGRKRRSMRGTGSGERVLQRCGRGKSIPRAARLRRHRHSPPQQPKLSGRCRCRCRMWPACCRPTPGPCTSPDAPAARPRWRASRHCCPPCRCRTARSSA